MAHDKADATASRSPRFSTAGRAPRAGSSSGGDLHSRVVEDIGQRIINSELAVGDTIYAEQVCERLSISRSVVREGLRTLSSLGLIKSRPQRGTRVLPRSNWDFLSPYVIRWRGQSPDRLIQMRELLELRLGIEHAAAYFAATRMSDAAAREAVKAAAAMKTAMDEQDNFAYFRADEELHRLMLEGSGNDVLAQFADTVTALLRLRGETNPLVYSPHGLARASLNRHIALADALMGRDADEASRLAREILIETMKEVQAVTPAQP